MAEARLTMLSVDLSAAEAVFRASGKRIDFPGFFRAYVEGSDDPDAALEGQEVLLSALKVGDAPNLQDVEALGHQTQPPARFSEASLVKMLEKEGIGRPSTMRRSSARSWIAAMPLSSTTHLPRVLRPLR